MRPSLTRPASASAPELKIELEALLSTVPRACRANARWAIPLLLETARAGGITHLRRIAYVLATAQHGASFGGALDEMAAGGAGLAPEAASFDRYEPGTPLGDALGNTQPGDGERFRGRGFVRIRGRAAYAAWSKRLGMPDQRIDGAPVPFFIAHPPTLARPNVAAEIVVRGMRDGIFTGVALGAFVNDRRTDFHNAHRVIGSHRNAREIALSAGAFAAAIERVHADRHEAHMTSLTQSRAATPAQRDLVAEIRVAIDRLSARGEVMPEPLTALEWDGEARQGKFVQLDHGTCALHIGRGTYVRLDVQRDLNGIVPPECRNMALKRSGEVQPAVRHGSLNSWR